MGVQSRRVWTPASYRYYVRNAIAAMPSATHSVLRSFAFWLEHDRHLVLATVCVRVESARWFVEAACRSTRATGVRALRSLTASRVESFFVSYAKTHGPAARRSMQAAMRLLLTFAASRGWVDDRLASAVPSMRSYRLAGVPRAMPERELGQLLEAMRTGRVSARDQAIIWLFASYGIRRGHVSALRLRDIDWRARTIVFRAHKRGKPIQHELLPAVADAIVRYLRTERPDGDDDEFVFVREWRPHQRLSPSAITAALKSCMHRLALVPRGPQSMRHSFASRLLRIGQSFKTIADLLGHRSLSAVAIYAKVKTSRLLEAAVEWPEVRP